MSTENPLEVRDQFRDVYGQKFTEWGEEKFLQAVIISDINWNDASNTNPLATALAPSSHLPSGSNTIGKVNMLANTASWAVSPILYNSSNADENGIYEINFPNNTFYGFHIALDQNSPFPWFFNIYVQNAPPVSWVDIPKLSFFLNYDTPVTQQAVFPIYLGAGKTYIATTTENGAFGEVLALWYFLV